MNSHLLKAHKKPTAAEKKATLNKALIRVIKLLDLSRGELSCIIGRSEASLSRMFSQSKYHIDPATKEGQLGILLLRLYRSLDTLFGGNNQQAQVWLRSKNKHLNAIPIELIQSIEGLVLTVQYLDAMRGKN